MFLRDGEDGVYGFRDSMTVGEGVIYYGFGGLNSSSAPQERSFGVAAATPPNSTFPGAFRGVVFKYGTTQPWVPLDLDNNGTTLWLSEFRQEGLSTGL